MSSGFGLTGLRLMRALGGVLGVNDPKQAPAQLKTDELIPVVAVDPGAAGSTAVQLIGSVSLAGLSVLGWQLVGTPDALSTPGLPPQAFFPINAELEVAILGLRIEIQFPPPPAPAPATSGYFMRVEELRQVGAVSMVEQSTFDPGMVTDGIRWQYFWSYPMWFQPMLVGNDPPYPGVGPLMAASPIYVPAGTKYGLRVQNWTNDYTALQAWPAGTTANLYAVLSTAPKGMKPLGL